MGDEGAGGGLRGEGADEGLRIDFLGPLRARRGGEPVALGPVRRQAVLTALVLRGPGLVTYGRLLADVWGAEPPGSGHQVLPSYVYALRKALDPAAAGPGRSVIRGGRGGYRFAPGAARTDLAALAEETSRTRRAKESGDHASALEYGGRALALFRGEPLPGLPGPFAAGERERLVRQRLLLRQERAECLMSLGRHADALEETLAASADHPHDEALAALRMRALYGGGRQAEALAVHRDMRRRLRDELGVEPSDALRRVHQAVLRRDDRLLLGPVAGHRAPGPSPAAGRSGPRPEPGPGGAADARPGRNDLPGDTACLVGRAGELALLTAPVPAGGVFVSAVDGTAGVGKSALVVRAAWTLADGYPDGCLYVDLHAHGASPESGDPVRTLRRLLRAVGGDRLPDGTEGDRDDDLESLVTAWRAATSGLRLLLVVDDARGADQVRPLLPAGPGSRVLVCGRQRLAGLDADLRLTVEPLPTADAVGLLRELLGGARADREPEAALALARRCGGLPLALRIASARLQNRPAWSLGFLAGRLSDDTRGLGELRAGDRSVEAAFRMSYDQLTPRLRRGFRALGLMPTAGFDGLCLAAMLGGPPGDAEDLLEDLVDASLLQQPHPGRYRLHDLVRAHARRLAAESPQQAAADLDAVLGLYTAAGRTAGEQNPGSADAGPGGGGSPFGGRREAAAWLEAVGGELVGVVACAVAAERFDDACRIAEALADHFVRLGQYHECRAALDLALPCADRAVDRRMPAALRNCLGMVDVYLGRPQQARVWFAEALRHDGGGPRERAAAVTGTGVAEWVLGRTDDAAALLEEAVELTSGLDDVWLSTMALCSLGAVRSLTGRHDLAAGLGETALAIAEKAGRPRILSNVLCFSADAHLAAGRHTQAGDLLLRAAGLARAAGDLPLRAASLSRLAAVEQVRGGLNAAVDAHHEALAALTPQSSTGLEMEVRVRLGSTYAEAGRHTEARREFRTALSLPGAGDHPRQAGLAREGLSGIGCAEEE
ncbi:AfsR/SARP family transcriptional regulator [Streptomyces genisteinicus]|uniref:SARP family transcriptional regulator n=1 Tax=Streptomyces genisteinicus TaxID=2768068 RepID=A0A7H0HLU9_9ACTN|nr:BTAD domain-containing putative transcriptional regulator [Streptomyces genisteinicus]QNP61515.1 SARP family transcriptional regulator [Streptomyces genisteinicus]